MDEMDEMRRTINTSIKVLWAMVAIVVTVIAIYLYHKNH